MPIPAPAVIPAAFFVIPAQAGIYGRMADIAKKGQVLANLVFGSDCIVRMATMRKPETTWDLILMLILSLGMSVFLFLLYLGGGRHGNDPEWMLWGWLMFAIASFCGSLHSGKQLYDRVKKRDALYAVRVHRKVPLHLAVYYGQTRKALAHIKAGADIHAKDVWGKTPLHYAAESGDIKTALVLVRMRADIEAKNDKGEMPLHLAAGAGHTKTALALVKAGADIGAKDNIGNTPLHDAALCGHHPETARALVKAGANVYARNDNGETPLRFMPELE